MIDGKTRIAVTLGGMALALLMAAYVYSGHWRPSDASYPRQGIDVSNHQGTIDWSKLPKQGVDFAYIKATEGGDFVDKSFAKNWAAAEAAGVDRGAYHFFTLCKSGREQAANFTRVVPRDANALPPVVDLEYLGNCSRRISVDALHKELNDFVAVVEAHSGKPIVLYLTQEFDEAYQVTKRVDRPTWLRSIIFEPRFTNRAWRIWQVSNFRRLDGIEGRVDWNVMDSADDDGSHYDWVGIQSEKALRQFIATLKRAAQGNDRAALAGLVRYPFRSYKTGQVIAVYPNSAALLVDYDKIFTPKVRGAIETADPNDLFVRDTGVMIGNGEVWFDGSSGEILIHSINP